METTRQKKFARTIQKELGALLQFEFVEFQGLLVTVRHVWVTPDLQLARIYLTCFPEAKIGEVLELLDQELGRVRYRLGSRLRQVVRVVPELEFFEDDTDREVSRINQLLEELELPPDDRQSGTDSGAAGLL